MMGPLIIYAVGEHFRERVLEVAAPGIQAPTPEALLQHLTGQLMRSLATDERPHAGGR
jgi:hypothetical protein